MNNTPKQREFLDFLELSSAACLANWRTVRMRLAMGCWDGVFTEVTSVVCLQMFQQILRQTKETFRRSFNETALGEQETTKEVLKP